MPAQQNSTRERLIRAAIQLFAAQGVTDTTTKQISEIAGVNEVTLFRHFGNKHGLLLAVIEEAAVFTQLGQTLIRQADQSSSIYQALKDYATACLQSLERVPEVVRSVVGEAGQFPSENREALGRGLTQANHYVADYFQTVIDRGQLQTNLPAKKLASLLNGMLLGYAVIEFTSEFHDLWQDRQDFLENLVTLFLYGAVSPSSPIPQSTVVANLVDAPVPILATGAVADLSADVVDQILRKVKKIGIQEYALVYVLFGAGLTPAELVGLQRSQYVNDAQHQILQIVDSRDRRKRGLLHGGTQDSPVPTIQTSPQTSPVIRQVPINQWIMGRRYGSYTRNPLTQWLKSRKDDQPALFLDPSGEPLAELTLRQQWREWTEGLATPAGQPLTIEQAPQTWCVEMLGRGMTVDELSILTGWDASQLQPYAIRAREKAVLEQAMRLDQKA